MQARPAALASHLNARLPIVVRWLLWISARNRATGATETVGLWTGEDHQDIVVDGQTRPYFGAGGLVSLDPIRSGVGTDIRETRARLSPMAPEVEMAIRGYDVRQAPIEVHRLVLNPATMAAVGAPVIRLRGWVNKAIIVTAGDGQEGRCDLTIVSSARAGTKALSLKKSDASGRLRTLPDGGQDRFFKYTDVSGAVPVKWGTK